MDGVSLSWRLLPQSLIDRHELQERAIVRSDEADREYRFLYRDALPVLPVWSGVDLIVVTWGCPTRRSKLPRARTVAQEAIQRGEWHGVEPEPVEIPASFGWDRGVWFRVKEGVQGILVRDEDGNPVVYMLTEPSTHYYRVMTRNDRMPVLCRERI